MTRDRGGDTMLALHLAPRLHGWDHVGGGASGRAEGPAAACDGRRPLSLVPVVPGNQSMEMQPERQRFGPYRLLRTLDAWQMRSIYATT